MKLDNEQQTAPIRQQANRIGSLIRSVRKQHGQTQAQLAERIGVTIPTLRSLESGDTSVSLHTFLAGLTVLNIENEVLHSSPENIHHPLPSINPGEKRNFENRLKSNGINSRDAENASWILSLSGRQRIQLLQKQEEEQKLCGIALR